MRDMSNTRKQIAARLGMVARPDAKAKMARSDQRERFLRIDPRSVERWESSAGQRIDSVGPTVWIFVDPSGKEIWLPRPMRFREAVTWLVLNEKQAKPNDYYKVALARPGAKAKFASMGDLIATAEGVAVQYGMAKETRQVRNLLEQIIRVMQKGGPGSQREALGLHAAIGGIAYRNGHGSNFMWTGPMAALEKQIRGLGQHARPGTKARMAVDRKKVIRDLEYLRDEARRTRNDSARIDAENWLKNVRKGGLKEQDWIEAESAASYISEEVQGRFSRPGAKAKMGAAPGVPELERLYAKFQESTRLFTPNKYRDAGEQKRMTSGQKKDFAFFENLLKAARSGDGKRAKALLAKTDALLTTHFVPKELRVWAAQFAAHGAKAKMAKPQFRVRKLHGGYLAVDMNQGSGWERYDTTHEEVFDGLEDYERGYQKAYDRGLRWSGGSWRIPSTKASRPGAKAHNAIREGEKVSASDDAVSRKIRKLMDEGKPQKQAVAIALDMKRRGEL